MNPEATTQLPTAAATEPLGLLTSGPIQCIPGGRYRALFASTREQRNAACHLRFEVFNMELGEGLAHSFRTGIDSDEFDAVCDHLIVQDASGKVVGTYRMQTGKRADAAFGYYSAREFNFAPYEPVRETVLELGRACVDRAHRTSEVLTLLWRGIAFYAQQHGLRYLIGCSSLNSQDAAVGWAAYRELLPCLAEPAMLTRPNPAYQLPEVFGGDRAVSANVPKLLRTYLTVGARICGPPALDREFGTIDFLTLLDLKQLTPAARSRFLPETQ